MNMKKKVFMGIATTALAMASIGVASADPIAIWDFDNRAGFAAWTPGSVNASELFLVGDPTSAFDPSNPPDNDEFDALPPDGTGIPSNPGSNNAYGTLRWGNTTAEGSNNQSGLISGKRVVGEVETGIDVFGDAVDGASLTHENWVITGNSLSTATLRDVLYIRSQGCDTCPTVGTAVDFEIAFRETPNSPTGTDPDRLCENGFALSAPINQPNGCADIFVVTAPLELIVGDFIEIPVAPGDGYLYTFRIGAVGLGQLNSTACASAGVAGGGTCLGWLTSENQNNTLQPFFQVRAQLIPVPAPATMLLFGAGLLALGATVRRRRS